MNPRIKAINAEQKIMEQGARGQLKEAPPFFNYPRKKLFCEGLSEILEKEEPKTKTRCVIL